MIGQLIEFKSVSVGEAILIVLAVLVPLSFTRRLRRKTFAFSINLSGQATKAGSTALVHLRVRANAPASLQRFNVRFVERRWFGLTQKNVPKDVIEISQLRGMEWRVPYVKSWLKYPDGVGGWDVIFDPPKQWVAGDLLDRDLGPRGEWVQVGSMVAKCC